MTSYVLDIETNGLLPELDRVHCLVLKETETGQVYSYADQPGYTPLADALDRMTSADMLIAHNGIGFDFPALEKVYGWRPSAHTVIRDTMICTRLIWTDLKDRDKSRRKKKQPDFPGFLVGSHSLKAWGLRLGNHKGDYNGGWDKWSPAMHEYMVQDSEVTLELWNLIVRQNYSAEAIQLEHDVAEIICRQERRGFAFNEKEAAKLYADLTAEKLELEDKLRDVFGGWWAPNGTALPKRTLNYKDVTKASMVEGCGYTKTKWVEFNPGSRHHIANRLMKLYGWKPSEFGKDGKPKVDEEVLAALPYPVAPILTHYLTVDKRIGQLATGKQAWLKHVKDGVVYGRVNTNGTVTGRMSHSNPNLGQVPATRSLYGKECRALFHARPGLKLLGIDADALEARCLAGYMAKYDKGAYVEAVLRGDKEKGTDTHSMNARALGLDPTKEYVFNGTAGTGRDHAKTWFYAYMYGAGNVKLGKLLGATTRGKQASLGKKSRINFEQNLPALGKLVAAVKSRAGKRGYLKGLDGRKLLVRSQHSALNMLLQSAGAIFMKKALVMFDSYLTTFEVDAWFVANVHDEWQLEVEPDAVDDTGKLGVLAIERAGEFFDFRCPLTGNYESGDTWADTH